MQKIIWNMGQMNEEEMAKELGVPLEKRIKKVCNKCGSEDVLVDAYANWDVELQDFVLHSTYDYCFCNKCEQKCDIEDVEVKE